VLAAERLSIKDVPVVVARGWTDKQKRAYRLADNELTMHAQWDKTLLRVELAELRDQGVDLELMGFAAEDAIVGGPDPLGDIPQALQLHPPREYVVVMCADPAEWERLKVTLSLTPVRRNGYRKGSPLDDVGTQRVVRAADLLAMIEPEANARHRPSKGRAGGVRTQSVLPDCSVFTPAIEAEAYRQAGVRNVVAVPNDVLGITATRNWILRHSWDRWVVMIDDDVRTHG
jgi:hypothetical protein